MSEISPLGGTYGVIPFKIYPSGGLEARQQLVGKTVAGRPGEAVDCGWVGGVPHWHAGKPGGTTGE